ncbi:MAG: hypothetical protein MZV70_20250 [Desulfobacterales bacterium]|nr:hypothetical protein [Desulfobacterales bacterium]
MPGVSGREARKLPRQILGEILEPRMEEIFSLVNREIYRAGMENHGRLRDGPDRRNGPARGGDRDRRVGLQLARPASAPRRGIEGLADVVNNPMYATGVGLVLYGARHQQKEKKKFRIRDRHIFNRLMSRMKRWFKDVV